jgi:hypothetical protein
VSAVYPAKDGTFELLDDLQEEGRCRFVKRGPKEELEAIVVAVWRERDRLRAQDIQRRHQKAPRVEQILTGRYCHGRSSAAREVHSGTFR